MTLTWYAQRLRSMGGRELYWRATKSLKSALSYESDPDTLTSSISDWAAALERFRQASDRPIVLDRAGATEIASQYPSFVAELISVADHAARNSFEFFAYPRQTLGNPIDWHNDPIAGIRWPAVSSNRINHRVAQGDVKWIWELNRLQHLPWLAQAWLFTGDSRYSHAAFEHLDSWIDQNPTGHGIAWRGAFEAGIRGISVSIALQGLRDSPDLTADRYRRIVGALASGAELCWRERSLHSSANNHLVGEMAGLAVVAMIFPELKEAARWKQSAVEVLCVEAGKQILVDGAGAEQAIGYQMFTVELLLLVAALKTSLGDDAPGPIVDAIKRSCFYLANLVGSEDPAPRYGDDDEGFALRLGPETVRTVRDHLGIVSALGWETAGRYFSSDSLGAQWYRAIANSSADTIGGQHANGGQHAKLTGYRRKSKPPDGYFAFDGGLAVLRNGSRRTTMDVGPLGYLSIAAHGHADALAVTLSVDGQDLIGDPGTGSYYGHPDWRSAMRGTRAHPTVCVDGQDQSINVGPFMWLRHARTYVRNVDVFKGLVDAEHDGYARLPGNVTHRRWLIAPPLDRVQVVVDLVTGKYKHEVRTSWPLHPAVEMERIPNGHMLFRCDAALLQVLHASTAPLTSDDVRGDAKSNVGWWSHRLESRTPTWWLGMSTFAELPVAIVTLFSAADGISTEDLSIRLQHNTISIQWTENRHSRVLEIDVTRSGAVKLQAIGR